MAKKHLGALGLDLETMVSRAQVVDNATELSTHAVKYLDYDKSPDIASQKICAFVIPKSAVVGTNSMQIAVVQADNAALTTNLEVLALSPAALALKEDVPVVVDVPEGSISKQYVGIRYTFGGTSVTVDAWIALQKSVALNPYFPNPFPNINEI